MTTSSGFDRFALTGQVALVLGGSSGIGRQIAIGFAEVGATVVAVGTTEAKVAEAVETISAAGHKAEGHTADVTADGALEALVNMVLAQHGRIDLLVNSQGSTTLAAAEEFRFDDYRRIMTLNADSVFWASSLVGRAMLERGQGAIINIASLAAHRGMQQSVAYTMSKHAVLGLTRTLAAEWAERGVRVNAITPGFFMTPMNRDRMSQARKDRAILRTPANRFGELEELVGAAIYLASPSAAFTTGTVIEVDGGFLAAGL